MTPLEGTNIINKWTLESKEINYWISLFYNMFIGLKFTTWCNRVEEKLLISKKKKKVPILALFVMKCGLLLKSHGCKFENSWRDWLNFNTSLESSLVLLKAKLSAVQSRASDCFLGFAALPAKALLRLNYLTAPLSLQTTHVLGLIFSHLLMWILTCSINVDHRWLHFVTWGLHG